MDKSEATRRAIEAAAGKLFMERGLGSVSMDDVAVSVGCTRRTIYRYYASKDELAFEVVEGLLAEWNRVQEAIFRDLEGAADKRLEDFLGELAGALDARRSLLRFFGEFDFVYRDTCPFRPGAEQRARFEATAHVAEDLIGQLLDRGLAEGSLRLPVAREVLIPTLSTALWGLAQRLAIRDDLTRLEFGVAGREMARAQITITMEALRAGI